jgi:hypothetical protein
VVYIYLDRLRLWWERTHTKMRSKEEAVGSVV